MVDTGLADFVTPAEFSHETGLSDPLMLEECLSRHGLVPEAIHIVINTHLHDDHCGNNPIFTGADHFIQQKELDFCKRPHPLDYRYEPDFIDGLKVTPVDGDLEILPGIDVLFTPGHTPGGQTVRIDTPTGRVIIPGFCCNRANFPHQGPAVCPGVHGDAYQAYDTAQRIKKNGGACSPAARTWCFSGSQKGFSNRRLGPAQK